MRVVLYARYSSDQQRAASIADQFRVCREFAERQGWIIVRECADAAMSGSSLMRPGFQQLMAAAMAHECDAVVAESLDRFSRDQEDTAGFFKRLTFLGIQIRTLAEGEIGHLHVGLKGTMNALYLTELAEKTRRGLRGRVEAGRSGGGLCYGYRAVRALEGEPRGERVIDQEEAEIVRRVFREFVAGASPQTIAKRLNAAGVAGPMGLAWNPSTIHGHARRGTGLLNNELYVGRLVWNRHRYVKNPDTGKRLSRLNPPELWITAEVPHLRIVDDELWQAAKARQAAARQAAVVAPALVNRRRPIYLFSGLTLCGVCGGRYAMYSHGSLACTSSRERGTCTNRATIKRTDVEGRVLTALREKLMDPRRFEIACEAFTRTMNRLQRQHRVKMAGTARELKATERQIQQVIAAIKDGLRTPSMKAEMEALEAKRAELAQRLKQPPLPAVHPQLAIAYREKINTLVAGLQYEAGRDAARDSIRGVIEKIVLQPEGDRIGIMVHGNLAAMLNLATGRKRPADLGLLTASYVGCGGGI